jgi:hypothetical protein
MARKKIRAGDEALGELHATVAQHMLEKLKSGEVTAADLSVMVKFLQNNQIVVDTSGAEGSAFDQLRRMSLPSFDDVEDLDKEEKWN